MRVAGAQERLVPRHVEGTEYYRPELFADGVEVTTPGPSTMSVTWARRAATAAFAAGVAVGTVLGSVLYAVGSHL